MLPATDAGQSELGGLREGTYVWVPWTRGWIVGVLWVLVAVQVWVSVGGRGESGRWEVGAVYFWRVGEG